MNKTIRAALAGAALVAALAGCAGSARPAHPVPTGRQLQAQACKLLALTAADNGGSIQIAAADTVIKGARKDYFGQPFSRDVLAVTDTGMSFPSAFQVGRLQRDCGAVGVKAPVWPASETADSQ